MTRSFVMLVFLFLAAASTEASQVKANFSIFETNVKKYAARVKLSAAVAVEPMHLKFGLVAKVKCRPNEKTKCLALINFNTLRYGPPEFFEFVAAHEVCHLFLKHQYLSNEEIVVRKASIEYGADLCTLALVGIRKFMLGNIELWYRVRDRHRTVPLKNVRKAIVRFYHLDPKIVVRTQSPHPSRK